MTAALTIVTTIHDSNYRDPVATLRALADAIEAGRHGEVGCVAVALLGDRMEVFAMGPDSEWPSAALLLHAGFLRLSLALADWGREDE